MWPLRKNVKQKSIIKKACNTTFLHPIVDPNSPCSYERMEDDLTALNARYPFLEIETIGKSVLGRSLYCLRLGEGHHEVFYNGAHHSLEWVTSLLLMKFAENLCSSLFDKSTLAGFDTSAIWRNSSIYIVPMVNPDGIDLVLNGIKNDHPYYQDLLIWNGNCDDFKSRWQANCRGVDLNHNYDAAWEKSKEAETSYGIIGPGPTRYSGPYPESEPETQSMVRFTRGHDFRLVLAFHSQGSVIYWNFMDSAPTSFRQLGLILASDSGYELDETTGISSFSGYKDWFIKEFARPGFTVEVGLGKNPLPLSQFESIYHANLPLLLHASLLP